MFDTTQIKIQLNQITKHIQDELDKIVQLKESIQIKLKEFKVPLSDKTNKKNEFNESYEKIQKQNEDYKKITLLQQKKMKF